jgi:hypothetical protein
MRSNPGAAAVAIPALPPTEHTVVPLQLARLRRNRSGVLRQASALEGRLRSFALAFEC